LTCGESVEFPERWRKGKLEEKDTVGPEDHGFDGEWDDGDKDDDDVGNDIVEQEERLEAEALDIVVGDADDEE
jgi:hypothetical protein